MYNSRSLEDLLPCVQTRAVSFIAAAESQIPGLKMIVCSTYRDKESQDALYAQGRTTAGRIVTNAKGGQSFHNFRVAFDTFPTLYGKPILFEKDGDEVSDPIWQKLGAIAKANDLEWAGLWEHFKEAPHFQYTGGLTLEDLANGSVPS
jgi:peptidoglycan L-alanyl-D-glutamate endopeptidase CwlK